VTARLTTDMGNRRPGIGDDRLAPPAAPARMADLRARGQATAVITEGR
jgi:hypothetical protein